MIRPIQLLTCLPILCFSLLAGCGGSNMVMTQPSVTTATITGAFSFAGQSQSATQPTIFIGGLLESDNMGHVSGMMGITTNPNNTTCFAAGSSALFSGTISSNGLLMLTSASVNGQMITLNAMVSRDGNFFTQGSYSVSGGCLAGDKGSVTVSHLLSGTYTGSFFAGGGLINVTLNFGPPGLPATDGSFPITAGATFTNSGSCGFTSAGTEGGQQSGLNVGFMMTPNQAGTVLGFNGSSIDSSATQFSGTVGIVGGPCDATHAAVMLKKM